MLIEIAIIGLGGITMKYNNLYTNEERKGLIATSLIFLRSQKGMTQKEVAEAIGIKLGTYNAYEKQRSEPPAEIIVRLAYFFDVSTDDILQKNNLNKDPEKMQEFTEEAQKAMKAIKEAIEEGNPDNLKMIAEEYANMGETISNLIKNLTDLK